MNFVVFIVMEFYIKKGATLPVLKMQIVKDGRSDYHRFMDLIETSTILFSMVDADTGIPKFLSKPAGFVSKNFINETTPTEYYVYYQFSEKDTNKPGRYEGEFLLRNEQGNLIVPLREKLYITIQDSFISDRACC